MTDIVLLNNIDHAQLRVAQGYGAAFGDAVNQALVFPTEFEALQRDKTDVRPDLAQLGFQPPEPAFPQ